MTKAVAEILWLGSIIIWYIIRYPFERRAKKVRVTRSLFDRREIALLAFAFFGLFAVPAAYVFTGFPKALDRAFNPAVAWLGLLVVCCALWLFSSSHANLGRNWSISLEFREQHRLVQTGVYRFIRHPMYSSFFLLGLSQLLLLPNWFSGGVGLVGAAVLYAFRIQREERMMIECFGEEYRAYMGRTKRVIPWII